MGVPLTIKQADEIDAEGFPVGLIKWESMTGQRPVHKDGLVGRGWSGLDQVGFMREPARWPCRKPTRYPV